MDKDELLRLADHVDVLVRFCAVYMPKDRHNQYYDGANAFWAMLYRIAGNDEMANKLIELIGKEGREPAD